MQSISYKIEKSTFSIVNQNQFSFRLFHNETISFSDIYLFLNTPKMALAKIAGDMKMQAIE